MAMLGCLFVQTLGGCGILIHRTGAHVPHARIAMQIPLWRLIICPAHLPTDLIYSKTAWWTARAATALAVTAGVLVWAVFVSLMFLPHMYARRSTR